MICPNCFTEVTAPTYDECAEQFVEHYHDCFERGESDD